MIFPSKDRSSINVLEKNFLIPSVLILVISPSYFSGEFGITDFKVSSLAACSESSLKNLNLKSSIPVSLRTPYVMSCICCGNLSVRGISINTAYSP